jgi:lysophospholipase L1-like esterase
MIPLHFRTGAARPPKYAALAALAAGCLFPLAGFAADAGPYRFDFGTGPAAPGYVSVTPDMAYSVERGFGFEPNSTVTAVARTGDPAAAGKHGFVTSDKPFLFSVTVPEGNYDVTVTLGDPEGESVTTVKAESRRLMLERVQTAKGEVTTRTFVVNTRNFKVPPPPKNAPGGDHVVLNDRENGPRGLVYHWDDKITLEFNNTRPCLGAIEITRVDNIPTVFIAGDSTTTDQPREPGASWGQMLPRFFNTGVAVANHAESGETLKSFITEMRLAKVLSQMKAGDYFFIVFGHNDEKKNWPQTYVEANTTYKEYLRVFIAETRRLGATPVILSPVQRRTFDAAGKIRNTHGDYPEAARQVALEQGVAFIDLSAMSTALYEALGPDKAVLAFAGYGPKRDATHHDNYGAYEIAKCVVAGIRANHLDLAKYLVDDVPPFDPAHPDDPTTWTIPASAGGRMTEPPRGN